MRFTKMQGIGNHFVVLDARDIPPATDLSLLATAMCAPHTGVGADGLLVGGIDASDEAIAQDGIHASELGISMRMFNPDGTEDMCGNGLRCIGLWALANDAVEVGVPFTVATKEGPRRLQILEANSKRTSGILTVDMGVPRFAAEEIPFCGTGSVIDRHITLAGRDLALTSVNTGSTHTVIFGDPLPEEDFQRLSPMLECHPLFPERTSIMWATPQGENAIRIRIWERGAGETFGCGTGACATAVAARVLGIAPEGDVTVISRGGALSISWPGSGEPITMTGPAVTVFSGDFRLD